MVLSYLTHSQTFSPWFPMLCPAPSLTSHFFLFWSLFPTKVLSAFEWLCCCPVAQLCPALWTWARQASRSFTISQSLLKLMSIDWLTFPLISRLLFMVSHLPGANPHPLPPPSFGYWHHFFKKAFWNPFHLSHDPASSSKSLHPSLTTAQSNWLLLYNFWWTVCSLITGRICSLADCPVPGI